MEFVAQFNEINPKANAAFGEVVTINGITPQLRINNDYWEVSYDNGETWASLGVKAAVNHSWNGTVLTVASNSGETSADLKGEKGDQGEQGIQGVQGIKGDKGDKGDKGEKGEGFSISKTYASVAEMHAAYATDNLPLNAFVLIDTGNVEDADNAKLYVKLANGYSYLTDLSGAQGIKGEKGDQGDKGDKGDKGDQGEQGIQGVQGEKGEKGDQGEQGVAGKDGTSVNILGSFDSPEELPTSDNTKGDSYLVSGHLYIWDGSQWVDGGNIQGVQGEKGDQGEQGIQGVQGEKGDKGDTGEQGVAGADGKTPYILNGYWWIGDDNTGVKAEGTAGVFVGSMEAYNEAYAAGKIPVGTIVIISEDDVSEDLTSAVLDECILDEMILE